MSATARIFISLLVHEKPAVILDQLRNFRAFVPEAEIVAHVSQSLEIDAAFARDANALGNVRLNPTQVATNKVNLLYPHLINLRFILGLSPGEDDIMAFHASNDMFVRIGLESFLRRHHAGYFHDGLLDERHQAESASIILADASFTAMRELARADRIIWSQIEGAFFRIKDLRRALAIIDESKADLTIKREYFAEEVMLPTLIHALRAPPIGTEDLAYPYVFSEISMTTKYTEIGQFFFGNTILTRATRRILRLLWPARITTRIIDGIAEGNIGAYSWFSRAYGKTRFKPNQLFAVKRIERHIDDPMREYIRTLTPELRIRLK